MRFAGTWFEGTWSAVTWFAMCLLTLALLTMPAAAQETPAEGEAVVEGDAAEDAPSAPERAVYDADLERLGEVSGALFHLDALCRPGRQDIWRRHIEMLLDAQRLGEEREGRLIARFNGGYRDYATLHRTCTPAARELTRRFAREGAAITADLAARYGN